MTRKRSASNRNARRRGQRADAAPAPAPQAGPLSRWLLVLLGVLVLGHTGTLLSQRLYPMIDLPFHLAAAAIHEAYGDPGNAFARFFALDVFPRPNTFHLLATSLLPGSVEAANRMLLVLYALAGPGLVFLILRRTGGNPWMTALAFLTLYGYAWWYGFVGFVLALPVILMGVWLLAAYDRRPTWSVGVGLAATGVLLFLVHALGALFFGLVGALAVILRWREGSLSRRLVFAWPWVPALLLLAWWWTGGAGDQGNTLEFLRAYYADRYVDSLGERLTWNRFDNRQLFATRGRILATGLFYLWIFVLAGWGMVRLWRGRRLPPGWRPVAAFFLAANLCFWLLPDRLPAQYALYQRFHTLVALAAVLVAGLGLRAGFPRWARAVTTGVVLVHLGLFVDYFRDFRAATADFTRETLPAAAPAEVTGGMIYTPMFRGRPMFTHFPCYQIVWNRRVASTGLTDFRFSRVRRKVNPAVLPPYHDRVHSVDYDGRYAYVEYILGRGPIPEKDRRFLSHFERVRGGEGESDWWVLRNRIPPEQRRPRGP